MVKPEVIEIINFYQGKLERKERLIKEYIEMRNNDINMNEKQYADYKVLQAEINMLKRFIDDLEDLKWCF